MPRGNGTGPISQGPGRGRGRVQSQGQGKGRMAGRLLPEQEEVVFVKLWSDSCSCCRAALQCKKLC